MARKQFEEKKHRDELEAARVFEEFIETFQNPDKNTTLSKSWVRGNVCTVQDNEEPRVHLVAKKLYKPSPVPILKVNQENSTIDIAKECARILPPDTNRAPLLRKKKSNLESFKEELELMHKDKIDRVNCEEHIKSQSRVSHTNRQHSTNLFVSNLHLNLTERTLLDIFGKFGAIANVKIMWSRAEDQVRSTNCGFVAYMSRKDADRAMRHMHGKLVMNCKLEIDWSKPIALPVRPIYVPPMLLELWKPPPSTGLPFNAQPPGRMPASVATVDEYLSHCTVQVVLPHDHHVLALIHRTIEYVLREGPLFEALIMTREMNNSSFRFLFDNRSAEHVYYRWKLYTMLHGEPAHKWSMQPYRMFAGGPVWLPPAPLDYSAGIPEALFNMGEGCKAQVWHRSLSVAQRDCLEKFVRRITPERGRIAKCLVFCMSHGQAAAEIAECLAQSLEKRSTAVRKLIGRLYLISDILCNCRHIAPAYLNAFEQCLPTIMGTLCETYRCLTDGPQQLLLNRVMRVFTAWKLKNIYPLAYVNRLQGIFARCDLQADCQEGSECSRVNESTAQTEDKTVDTGSVGVQARRLPGFTASRWETVDPETVQSQAITSTQWPNYFTDTDDQCLHSKTISDDKQTNRK